MGNAIMNDEGLYLLAGRTIEHAVKDQIKQRYPVVMTSNIETGQAHGPRLDGMSGATLADLQLYRGVRAGWVEVKAKTRSNWWFSWKRYEHGIDRAKWDHYWQLQSDTAQTVYLMVCEAGSDILMQSLSTLQSQGTPRPGFWGSGDTRRPCINFDRDAFAKVGMLNIPADDLRQVTVRIDWDRFETFCTQPMLIEEEQYDGKQR
jgi:hypothetical protein